ncbi:Ger(x)C family spore germination protein [Paenibacillus sp. HJGM_3]|uniref:Ger(x)C family spore germination protein n=1 Tax=Paenibacillus sp. HJGM_3 TaxID=3379816 RepID=UPI00385F61B5
MSGTLARWGRRLILLVAAGPLLLIAGCWDRTEVNDLALVTGAAIDQVDDTQIELTIQIFIPQGTGGGGLSGSQKQTGGSQITYTISATGTNIAEAISHMQEKMPRKIFWGHSEIFLFGEKAARNGIEDDIDFLMRAPQPRERAYLYTVEGEAKRILEVHSILERTTAEVLREMSKSKVSLSVTLAEFGKMLTGDTNAAAMPWLRELLPLNQQSTKSSDYTVGTAVFHKDKLAGVLNDTASRGVLWIRDEIRDAVITVKPADVPGNVSLRMVRSSTKLKPVIQDGKWSMTVKIKSEYDALQNGTKLDLATDNTAIHDVEEAANQEIESRVRQALELAQKKWKTDIFDFAGEFHRKYPQAWKKRKDEWEMLFPQMEVRIESDTKLLRPGSSNIKSDLVKEQTPS